MTLDKACSHCDLFVAGTKDPCLALSNGGIQQRKGLRIRLGVGKESFEPLLIGHYGNIILL